MEAVLAPRIRPEQAEDFADRLFRRFDRAGLGVLNREQIMQMLMQIDRLVTPLPTSEPLVRHYEDVLDRDKDGKVTKKDFRALVLNYFCEQVPSKLISPDHVPIIEQPRSSGRMYLDAGARKPTDKYTDKGFFHQDASNQFEDHLAVQARPVNLSAPRLEQDVRTNQPMTDRSFAPPSSSQEDSRFRSSLQEPRRLELKPGHQETYVQRTDLGNQLTENQYGHEKYTRVSITQSRVDLGNRTSGSTDHLGQPDPSVYRSIELNPSDYSPHATYSRTVAQEAFSSEQALYAKRLEAADQLWRRFDPYDKKVINTQDLGRYITELYAAMQANFSPSSSDIHHYIHALDPSGRGQVERDIIHEGLVLPLLREISHR